ncbi:MAG: MFS transporter [Pseudomonadota bacterium]
MKPMSLPLLLYYGMFGMPLAMVALPVYVYLPKFYADRAALPLSMIGAVLLAARLAAAFIDPLLGWWIARGQGAYARFIGLALPLLLAGFVALFHPPVLGQGAALAWFFITLMLVNLGLGIATIAHQSWGAALTQAASERARITGMREACALAGVVLAAGVTGALGYGALSLVFAVALLVGAALLLVLAVRPACADLVPDWRALWAPCGNPRFRALFAVLIVNGVASAIPATLFLFFASDHLRLPSLAGVFLILYFGAAALSMPFWVAAAGRFGEARAWVGGMLLSCLVFVCCAALDAGAALAFGAICAASGLALGADLALPPALLAGVIAKAGHAGQREAAYFGLWNWGVHLTLALAAGIALPLLGWWGYAPGATDTGALVTAYALLPCALKLVAAAMLWRAPLHDC